MKSRKIIILILTILFFVLCVLVETNLINIVDNAIYSLVTINMNNTITSIYKVITFFGSTLFIILLCVFFLILFIVLRKKNIGIIITSFLILSTIINNLLKIIFRRDRPDVIKFVSESTYSFPSGHTMASVSMYGILIYLVLRSNMNKKLKITLSVILGIIPMLVGLSRVYLGAHYISDVIGSFLVTIILLLIVTYVIDYKKWL